MKVRYHLRNREARRLAAQQRQTEQDKRTPEQQLARLNAGGYRAERERRRLEALIAERERAA